MQEYEDDFYELLRLDGREGQHEDRPFSHIAFHGNGAMMRLDNFFHDGEAEAMPAGIPGTRRVGPVKRFEEMRQMFTGNSLPRIPNSHPHLSLRTLQR